MDHAKRRPGWVAAVWLAGAATLQAHFPTVTLTSTYVNFAAAPGTVAPAQTVRLGTNDGFRVIQDAAVLGEARQRHAAIADRAKHQPDR